MTRLAGSSVRSLFLVGIAAVACLDCPPTSRAAREQQIARLLDRDPRSARPVQRVEALLPLLPSDLTSNFTFVHHSRSAGGKAGHGEDAAPSADPMHPRVILFSDDARLVLAFTGNPDRSGYDVLEVMHWNDARASFELSRFVLPEAVRRDPSLAASVRHNGEINPPHCLTCHGEDPRPIFDSYPLWPGFYGSVLDTFPPGAPELDEYRAFLAAQKASPTGVYRQLRWPAGTSVPPYLDPAQYDPEADEVFAASLPLEPNARLGIALTELNRKRIERKLAASPRYRKYRYGLLAVLLDCQAAPLARSQLMEVETAIAEENADRIDRLGFRPRGPRSVNLDMMELRSAGTAAQILYVARVLGVSAHDFSLAFDDGSLSFYDGILSGLYDGHNYFLKEDFALEMLRRLAADEPEFRAWFSPRRTLPAPYSFGEKLDIPTARKACQTLLRRQQELAAALPAFDEGLVPP